MPKSERGRVWREAMRRGGWSWRLLFGSFASIALAVPFVFLDRPIAAALGLGRTGEQFILLAGLLGGQLVGQQVLISAMRPYLRQVIGGLCVHCGYDLRSSPARCPECGKGIEGDHGSS